jgi:hypothetical protein
MENLQILHIFLENGLFNFLGLSLMQNASVFPGLRQKLCCQAEGKNRKVMQIATQERGKTQS